MIYEKETYHFLFLHFPIALFIIGYLYTFLAFFLKDDTFHKFGFWNLGLGILFGIFSIITGFITDNEIVGHMDNPLPVLTTHGTHMIVSILLFIIFFIFKVYFRKFIKEKYFLFMHTILLIFFIHGTHIGAKLADRI